jgi:hypothetical protein
MTFEDDKYVILNLGAGRQEQGFENNKVDDLCPACYRDVEEFIEGDAETKEQFSDVERAQSFLKEQGYVSYKPTAHRNRNKK